MSADRKRKNNSIDLSICPTKLSSKNEKQYQKTTLKEIIAAVNALFNSDGGTLTLRYDRQSPKDHVEKSLGKIEQKIEGVFGVITLARDVNITVLSEHGHSETKINVKTSTKTETIVTVRYNMFLPSRQHVLEVLPTENVEKIKAILTKSIDPVEPTKPDSHHKRFIKGEGVSFPETDRDQFKNLKDTKENRISFADRLVGNRFVCYVSAFANHGGGHIYFGINDNGVVEGEHLTDTEKEKTEKEIQKVISKMVWPKKSEPGEGNEDRYQVHFEPVREAGAHSSIQSLYVVVVFIAQCPGGVFTAEPVCYEMVDNKCEQTDFETWKKRFDPRLAEAVDSGDSVYEKLTNLINNNCNEQILHYECTNAQKLYSQVEVELICLSKKVCFFLRRRDYPKAEKLLKYYRNMLPSTTDKYFTAMEQYLHCVLERGKGEYQKSYEIAEKSSDDLNKLPHSLFSASFFLQIATIEHILGMNASSREERLSFTIKAETNYDKAKRQLNTIRRHTTTKVEFKQKVYIYKALLYLGSSLTGDMLADSEEQINIEKAKHFLSKTQDLVNNSYPLSKFRKIQYLFVQACLSYRLCSSSPSRQAELLRNAANDAKEAQQLAKECSFLEMETYAQNFINFFDSTPVDKQRT